jgi:hypothetical protein
MPPPPDDASPRSGPAGIDHTPVDAFLVLVADQLQEALAEASVSLDGLTQDVLELARRAGDDTVVSHAAERAFIRLQAVDRMHQRVTSVDRNLRRLASLLGARCERPEARDWAAFLAEVRARYTTETERDEFDAAAVPGPEPDLW